MFKNAVIGLAAIFLYPSQSLAVMQCEREQSHVSVNGSVTTLNVSATKQVGQICLSMIRTRDGREVFNDCGALVGKIVSSDVETGSSTLVHTAVFDPSNALLTNNDQAQITGILAFDESGTPCSFSVVETISEILKGTGIFRNGKIGITANGNISFCPDKNLNTFTLQGEACVSSNHRQAEGK